ncbi:MAG TPA: DUF3307 domain-containing protein [Bauldia sp.]|nr:DUF3307 domain-containing protein [Bauldia sp.]
MNDPVLAVLTAFVVLQVKHFLCDYPLQTGYQLRNKSTYGHPGGLLHSGIHAVGTLPVFLVITPPLAWGVAIFVGEFLLHYHIDWAKGNIIRKIGSTASDRSFWWAIGFDQLLHHLTYVAIAAILIYHGTY